MSANDAEERVWQAIEQVLQQPEIIAAEVSRQQAGAKEQRTEILREISLIEDTMAKCDREEQRWAQAYVAEVINLTELKGYRSEIATRRHSLLAQRHDLQTNLDNVGHALEHVEALMGYCERVRQQWQTFDPAEKRRAFEALNVRITWTPGQPLTIEGTIPLGEIVPVPLEQDLSHIIPADRAYVAAEMNAFLRFWLRELSCPMLNRPTPNGFAGPQWRHEQWVHTAARLGIPVLRSYRHIASTGACAAKAHVPAEDVTVTIVGGQHVGAVDEVLAKQVRRLADAAGVDLLAVRFNGAEVGSCFVSANPWPDITPIAVTPAVLDYFGERSESG